MALPLNEGPAAVEVSVVIDGTHQNVTFPGEHPIDVPAGLQAAGADRGRSVGDRLPVSATRAMRLPHPVVLQSMMQDDPFPKEKSWRGLRVRRLPLVPPWGQ